MWGGGGMAHMVSIERSLDKPYQLIEDLLNKVGGEDVRMTPPLSSVALPATALACIAAVLLALAGPAASSPPPATAPKVAIETVATRADLVTGQSTPVQIVAPGVNPRRIRVTLGSRTITSAFATRPDGSFEGRVTGLRLGRNVITARVGAAGAGARLTITDHPISGPLFSGPHIEPWICQPGDTNAQCDHPTENSLYYYSRDATLCAQPTSLDDYIPGGLGTPNVTECFVPYNAKHPPKGIRTVTTDRGVTVPFIIRVEKFWQDRDQGQLAVLYRPGSKTSPWAAQKNDPWNHRLEITQGEACGGHNGESSGITPPSLLDDGPPSVADPAALRQGFMVMSTALNNSFHDCNVALQAESLVIAKEHIVDQYGSIDYTFGRGCSGGSLSQNQVTNAYPGIYQGLITSCTFPDAVSTAMDVSDCDLFLRYFGNNPSFSDTLQAEIEGKQSTSVCDSWIQEYPFWVDFEPTLATPAQTNGGVDSFQNCGLPAAAVFDPVTNPKGHRCDLFTYYRNVLGIDPQTGTAYRPIGNAGVEYGLVALRRGQITPAQFAALNASIGSYNNNYQWQASRATPAKTGLVRAYRSGALDEATNLNQVAIIDMPIDVGDIHEPYRSFAIRARLQKATGQHANQLIWYTNGATPNAMETMITWLNRVSADHRTLSFAHKIVADKPRGAHDIITRKHNMSTREAAGGPLASDVLQCQLQPLRRSQFTVTFTAAEWASLQRTFPRGVCNWSKPGVGQQSTIPWLSYQSGPGGKPLGAAPVSTPSPATRS
jgi:Tannase-like family of unknown function (DUF6351)